MDHSAKKQPRPSQRSLAAMKEKSRFIGVGITIYIALSGIDRFVYPIPNVIYIPFAILGIALILIGFFKGKSK